jgi:hypothetical protein
MGGIVPIDRGAAAEELALGLQLLVDLHAAHETDRFEEGIVHPDHDRRHYGFVGEKNPSIIR